MDKRKVKTQEKIRQAYVTLLMEKGDPHNVSIVDLCEKADVNRATFYENFRYMDNLIEFVVCEELKSICNIYDDSKSVKAIFTETTPDVIAGYVNKFRESSIFNYFMKDEDGRENFIALVVKMHIRVVKSLHDGSAFQYNLLFRNSGVFAVVLDWMTSGMKETTEEISAIIYNNLVKLK